MKTPHKYPERDLDTDLTVKFVTTPLNDEYGIDTVVWGCFQHKRVIICCDFILHSVIFKSVIPTNPHFFAVNSGDEWISQTEYSITVVSQFHQLSSNPCS